MQKQSISTLKHYLPLLIVMLATVEQTSCGFTEERSCERYSPEDWIQLYNKNRTTGPFNDYRLKASKLSKKNDNDLDFYTLTSKAANPEGLSSKTKNEFYKIKDYSPRHRLVVFEAYNSNNNTSQINRYFNECDKDETDDETDFEHYVNKLKMESYQQEDTARNVFSKYDSAITEKTEKSYKNGKKFTVEVQKTPSPKYKLSLKYLILDQKNSSPDSPSKLVEDYELFCYQEKNAEKIKEEFSKKISETYNFTDKGLLSSQRYVSLTQSSLGSFKLTDNNSYDSTERFKSYCYCINNNIVNYDSTGSSKKATIKIIKPKKKVTFGLEKNNEYKNIQYID